MLKVQLEEFKRVMRLLQNVVDIENKIQPAAHYVRIDLMPGEVHFYATDRSSVIYAVLAGSGKPPAARFYTHGSYIKAIQEMCKQAYKEVGLYAVPCNEFTVEAIRKVNPHPHITVPYEDIDYPDLQSFTANFMRNRSIKYQLNDKACLEYIRANPKFKTVTVDGQAYMIEDFKASLMFGKGGGVDLDVHNQDLAAISVRGPNYIYIQAPCLRSGNTFDITELGEDYICRIS